MARLAQIVCASTLVLLAGTTSLRADPINILSGSVFIPTPGGDLGSANLVGTRGFSLTARAGLPGAIAGLFIQCDVPECRPGTTVNLNLELSGASEFLGGVMTIEGDQYDVNGSVNSTADVFLDFDGSFIAPEMGPAQATVTTPFSLSGRAFAISPFGGFAHDDQLFGHGVSTVTLVPFGRGFDSSWTVDNVRFDIAQPTPEPSTLLLIGTCVAGSVICRVRRLR